MAAKSLPTINLQGLDPDEIKSLNRELAKLANIEPKLRLSTKALGGAYGRYTSALRKGAETTVLLAKLSQDQSIQKMSVKMEESLLSTLSFMERSAYKTKQAVTIAAQNTTASEKARSAALMDSAKERVIIETRVEKEIRKIEESILETRRNTSNMSKEEVKKEVESKKELISVQEKYLDYEKTRIKTEEKSIAESATVSDRLMSNFRDLLQKFADAQTDDQRELIQQRIEGQMLAEKDTLEILTDKYESEKEIIKAGEAELGNLTGDEKSKKETEIKVRKHAILTLNKEISTLKTDTEFRQKQVEATSGQYKKGKRGFAGEVVSKSFTGGLFGALKGEGFGDIFTNMFKIGLERTGILGKKLPKMLGGGNVGAVLYGSQSDEARKASTQTTERIKASGAGISKISTYNEQLDTNLQKAGVAPAVKKTQPTLASTTAVSPDVFSKSITDAVSQSVFTAQEQIPEGTDSLDVNTAIRNAVFSAIVDTTKSTQSTTGALTTEDIMSVMSAVESALRTTEETATSEEVLTTTINALTTKLQSIETAKTALPLEPTAVAPLQTTAEAVEPEQVTTSGKKKSVKTTGVGGIVTDSTTIQSLVLFTDEMKSFAESIKTINQSITTGLDSLTKQITTIASSDLVSTYESTIKSVTDTLTNLELATKQLTECETTLKSTTDAVYAVFDILKTKTTDVSASEEHMKTVTEAVSTALQSLQNQVSDKASSEQVLKTVTDSVSLALTELQAKTSDISSSETKATTGTASVSEQVLKTVTDSVSLAIQTQLQNLQTNASTSSTIEEKIKTVGETLQLLQLKTAEVTTAEEFLRTTTESVTRSFNDLKSNSVTTSFTEATTSFVDSIKSINEAIQSLTTKTLELFGAETTLSSSTIDITKSQQSETLALNTSSVVVNLDIDTQKKSTEQTSKTTEEISRLTSAFDVLTQRIEQLAIDQSKISQEISTASNNIATESLKTNTATSTTAATATRSTAESTSSETLQTSTDAASSALNRVTTTAISLDSAKKDLSETVVRTDDSMTNLGTNINTVVDSIDVSLLQRESTTGEVNTSKDISDELARLKTEETSESNSKKTKTVSTKQKAEDEALVMSEESTRSLIELTAVGKSSSDDLKTIAKVTSEQNARQESSTVSVSDENLRTLADRNISIGEDLVRTSIETMETLRQSVSRQPEGSPGSLLPSGESRMPKMDEFVPLAQEAYTSMIELSKSALEQGSIYTHDIHSEQILSSILSIMRSDSEALSSTQESSEKTAEKTTESSEDLKTQSQKSNEMSKESGKETWKSLYTKTKDKLKEDVRNVVNKSIDTVENVKEKIKSAAGGIKDTTIGLAKKAYSSASGVAQTVGGAIGRKYTAVRESIGRGMIAAKEGTVKGLTTAKESLGRGYTIAKEAVGGRLRATKEKISKFGSTAYAGIKNIFSGRSRESNTFREKVSKFGSKTYSAIKNIFSGRSRESTSRSTSTSFLKIAKEKMSSTFKSVGEFFTKPRGSVGGILNNTKMGIKSAFGRVTKFFGKGEKGVSSGSIISRAKSTLKNTYNRVTDFTKGKFGSLATAAKGGIKGLLGFGKEEANGKSEETALYTKDIQADKWLEDIYNFLKDGNGKKVDEGSSESKDGQGGKEGAAPGGMGKKKGGIGGFLSSLAEGIKSFGDMKVIRGALGLAAVGVSMIPFAIGMGILGQIPFSGILSGLVAIAGLAAILIVVSKFEGDILMGALALAAVGLAMMPLAYSMQMMSGIDLSTVGVALAAVTGLALVAGVIGAIALTGVGAAAIAAGAALIAVIGLAMMPLAIGLQMMSAADPGKLSALAGSLMALVPPIALFSLISPMMALAGLGMIGFGAGLALMSLADPKVLSELAKSLMDLVLPLGIFGFLAELMVLAGIGLGAIGLGMIPLALVTNMINEKGMDAIVGFVNALAAAGPMLIIAALGILATGAALLVLTSAIAASNTLLAAGNILGDIASYLGFDPGPGILGVITTLASQSAQLLQTATALLTIADAVEKVGAAFGALSANPEIALETISTLVSMDATKIQNLQDVSLAMERVTTANQQLRGENQAMRTGAAIGEAGGMGGNASIVNATTVGNTNMIVSPPGGRNSDPSILFSGERYYSMLYR